MKIRVFIFTVSLLLTPQFIVRSAETPKRDVLEFSGILYPCRDTVIQSQITSEVAQILAREGDNVKEDQILIRLDTTNEALKLRMAEIEVERERIDNEKATLEFNSAKALYERKALDKEELYKARREQNLTQLSVKEAEINLEKVRKILESAAIRSPFDGTIAKINKYEGDSVMEGEELVRIVDSQELLLVAAVASGYYGKVKKGTEITFKTEYTKEIFKTRIESIIPYSNEGDKFKITAVISNRALKLLPGTKVSCSIKLRK